MIEKILKFLKVRFAGDLMLKDGTPLIISGDLAIGVKVEVQGPDGNIPLPAGSYELETSQIITVDDKGIITDIVDQVETPENPDTPTGVPAGSPEVEVEDEIVEPTETPTEKPDMMKVIDELTKKIADLEAKIAEIDAKTSKLTVEATKFSSDITDIKTKANFTKEITKNSTPDVVITSSLVDKINNFKKLKK